MAKRSARRLRLRRALRILLLIALLGSVLYLLLEKSLTQVILNTAYAKAYAIAVETMNEAVRESLQSGAAYEDLITVRTDGAGRITMLAANTARMNELAVSVALRAQSALETRDSASIAVPLGAALKAPFTPGRPKFVCCETVKGKGVSFMENKASWHGSTIKQADYEAAIKELKEAL